MNKVILDTDTLSEISKGIDQVVLNNATLYLDGHDKISFTSVSVYEVLYGLNTKNAIKQREHFLELVEEHEELVPNAEDYRIAAEIRSALHVGGTPIGSIDPLIAACAIRLKMPLVTGNIRHHGYIQKAGFSLNLVNWRQAL